MQATDFEKAAEATGVSELKPYTVSVSYDVPYVETFDVMAANPECAAAVALEMAGQSEGGRGGHYADDGGPSYVDCVAEGTVECPFNAPQLMFPVDFADPQTLLAHKSGILLAALVMYSAVDLAKSDAIEKAYSEYIKALRDLGYHKFADKLPKETL